MSPADADIAEDWIAVYQHGDRIDHECDDAIMAPSRGR